MDIASVERIHETTHLAGAMGRIGGHNILMPPPLALYSKDVQAIVGAVEHGLAAI